MKEVKENLKKTICKSCVWVQKELEKTRMSPEVVAAIPETLNSISKLINVYNEMPIYPETKDGQSLLDHQGCHLPWDKQQNKQQSQNVEISGTAVLQVHPTHQSALETSQKRVQSLLDSRGDC